MHEVGFLLNKSCTNKRPEMCGGKSKKKNVYISEERDARQFINQLYNNFLS